jgi:hypothetical protein
MPGMPTFGSTSWWIILILFVALLGVYFWLKKQGKI